MQEGPVEVIEVWFKNDEGHMVYVRYNTRCVPSLEILVQRLDRALPQKRFYMLCVITAHKETDNEIWAHDRGFASNVNPKAPIGAELIHRRARVYGDGLASLCLAFQS